MNSKRGDEEEQNCFFILSSHLWEQVSLFYWCVTDRERRFVSNVHAYSHSRKLCVETITIKTEFK
jgi:hypothetical protein